LLDRAFGRPLEAAVEKIYAFCGNVFTGRTQKALDGYVSFPHGARSSMHENHFQD
jgi:hypothetical protein